MDRRKFLKLATSTMLLSGLKNKYLLGKSKKSFSDSKALVCVFLMGGSDGFNMLLPKDGAKYSEYKDTRQGLALSENNILGINPLDSQGFNIGMHQNMPDLKTLFDNKQLAWLANVGNLIKPMTQADYLNKLVEKPAELFSHNSQQKQWQVLNPTDTTGPGWAGRLADLINGDTAPLISPNINLGSFGYWQLGKSSRPFNMKSSGLIKYTGMSNDESTTEMKRKEIFERILTENVGNDFVDSYADIQKKAIHITELIGGALTELPEIQTTFPEKNNLGDQLKAAAKLIAIQDKINMPRQIFFITQGGYDTHDGQNSKLNDLMKNLNDGLFSFQNSLSELGVQDKVITFTASEFGRTLTSNGDGTDHGWGNHLMVMGNPVKGGNVYGQMPELVVGGFNDSRNGRVIPTISVEQYAATLTKWFGFSDSEITDLFPNLSNFSTREINFI